MHGLSAFVRVMQYMAKGGTDGECSRDRSEVDLNGHV